MNRRRILWFSHLIPWPPKGGVQQRSFYLMKELAKYHDVTVAGFYQRAHQRDESEVEAATTALGEFCDVAWFRPLPADARPRSILAARSLFPPMPYTVRWAWSQAAYDRLRQLVSSTDFDLAHFDTVGLSPYAGATSRLPSTMTHHNIESEMMLRRADHERNPVKQAYFRQEGVRLRAYERKSAQRFVAHLVCSKLDEERLNRCVGDVPISIVPNGVDTKYFSVGDNTRGNEQSIVFVGRLSWYPNMSAVTWFIREVWPKVKARMPDVTITIAGRAPPAALLEAARQDSSVRVPGFIDDIRPLVQDAAIYVCPIFDGGGTKLKMLDAMAMGKAIVAHPIACEGLGLMPGEHVLLAETPDDFANAIYQLRSDPAKREALGTAARKHAEDYFSFEMIGQRLADLYSRLAGPRKA